MNAYTSCNDGRHRVLQTVADEQQALCETGGEGLFRSSTLAPNQQSYSPWRNDGHCECASSSQVSLKPVTSSALVSVTAYQEKTV
jgi:hypothetical protein